MLVRYGMERMFKKFWKCLIKRKWKWYRNFENVRKSENVTEILKMFDQEKVKMLQSDTANEYKIQGSREILAIKKSRFFYEW